MNGRSWIIAGAVLGALGVSLGAFEAHGLRDTLDRLVPHHERASSREARTSSVSSSDAVGVYDTVSAPTQHDRDDEIKKRMGWFGTAVRYQMYHAFGLVLLGMLVARGRSWWLTASGAMFVAGILLFSGLLFAMTFGGPRMLGAIVPLGGLAMILGWLAMAMGAWRIKEQG